MTFLTPTLFAGLGLVVLLAGAAEVGARTRAVRAPAPVEAEIRASAEALCRASGAKGSALADCIDFAAADGLARYAARMTAASGAVPTSGKLASN